MIIVKLQKRHSDVPDLTPDQPYVVIGIEADDLRILNDQGRPFLYPANLFEIIVPHQPHDWVSEVGADGKRYAYPPLINEVGFFEDFFDGRRRAVATFGRASINVLRWRRNRSAPPQDKGSTRQP